MKFTHKNFNGIKRTERIEAFSDGVFAIAITLLILSVAVPELSTQEILKGQLIPHLISLWPKFLSYIISFSVIGIFWVGHHIMFGYIKRSDRVLMWLNIILLMIISFIPFPAALMGEYGKEQISIIIYGGTLVLAGLAFKLLWMYASYNHRLIDKNLDPSIIAIGSKAILVAPLVYGIAIGVSFINPLISILIYILVPLLYILPSPIDILVENTPEN